MTGTFSSLNTALSALRYNRVAMDVASWNIANVCTDGLRPARGDRRPPAHPPRPALWSRYDGAGDGVRASAASTRMIDALLNVRARAEHGPRPTSTSAPPRWCGSRPAWASRATAGVAAALDAFQQGLARRWPTTPRQRVRCPGAGPGRDACATRSPPRCRPSQRVVRPATRGSHALGDVIELEHAWPSSPTPTGARAPARRRHRRRHPARQARPDHPAARRPDRRERHRPPRRRRRTSRSAASRWSLATRSAPSRSPARATLAGWPRRPGDLRRRRHPGHRHPAAPAGGDAPGAQRRPAGLRSPSSTPSCRRWSPPSTASTPSASTATASPGARCSPATDRSAPCRSRSPTRASWPPRRRGQGRAWTTRNADRARRPRHGRGRLPRPGHRARQPRDRAAQQAAATSRC